MMLFIKHKNEKSQYVKLSERIYGLQQAGLLWYQNIRSEWLQLGAYQCPEDECLFNYEFKVRTQRARDKKRKKEEKLKKL